MPTDLQRIQMAIPHKVLKMSCPLHVCLLNNSQKHDIHNSQKHCIRSNQITSLIRFMMWNETRTIMFDDSMYKKGPRHSERFFLLWRKKDNLKIMFLTNLWSCFENTFQCFS